MRIAVAFFLTLALITTSSSSADAQRPPAQKNTQKLGKVMYGKPKLPAHQGIHDRFRERKVLERFQRFFSAMRTPRPLSFRLTDCEGEVNAWYEPSNGIITVCYEYVEDILRNAPKETTADGVTPDDAVVGPVIEVFLHEAAHAFFDMLKIPILGREEDAADQLAAYVLLQFGDEIALSTIRGVAHLYATEVQSTTPGLKAFASEHSLPIQRFFNLACIAFGHIAE